MAKSIASLGRNQLKKIDLLSERRKLIYRKLALSPFSHYQYGTFEGFGDVFSHFVLRVSGNDIFETIERFMEQGLSLSTTWTARQKKWRHLDSRNMKRIEKEILVMSLNPDLKEREIEQLMDILKGLKIQEAHEPSLARPLETLKL
jgi:dTDP-4-amino-4,6-dideoxygalactose transaminase